MHPKIKRRRRIAGINNKRTCPKNRTPPPPSTFNINFPLFFFFLLINIRCLGRYSLRKEFILRVKKKKKGHPTNASHHFFLGPISPIRWLSVRRRRRRSCCWVMLSEFRGTAGNTHPSCWPTVSTAMSVTCLPSLIINDKNGITLGLCQIWFVTSDWQPLKSHRDPSKPQKKSVVAIFFFFLFFYSLFSHSPFSSSIPRKKKKVRMSLCTHTRTCVHIHWQRGPIFFSFLFSFSIEIPRLYIYTYRTCLESIRAYVIPSWNWMLWPNPSWSKRERRGRSSWNPDSLKKV